MVSCYDDKGNYDYNPINELDIKGIDNSQWYEQLAHTDTLKIYPEIKSSLYDDDSDSRYEYEWKIIPSEKAIDPDNDTATYIVSREKDLEYFVTLPAGDYRCSYIVRDKENLLEKYTFFYLRVKTLTSEGWMVLCDQDGESRLDILFNINDSTDIISHNIWSESLLKKGKPINALFSYNTGGYSARLLLCDNGTYNMDRLSLAVEEENDLIWEFGIPVDKIDIRASAINLAGGTTKYWGLVDKTGELYLKNTAIPGSVFEFAANLLNGQTKFKAAPFIGISHLTYPSGASMLLYDDTNKQFLEIAQGASYPSVMRFSGDMLFDAKTGRDIVHLESTKEAGVNYAILKDPINGKYYYYGIQLQPAGKNSQIYYGEILGAGLDQVKQFACHHRYPYIFYSSGNKIYQFDINNPNREAKEVLSFPGETIQVIKFNVFVAWEAYKDWERERNFQLLVATNKDGADEDNCGIIRMYSVPNLMGDLVKKSKNTGFGKIVDVTYRERDKEPLI